METRLLWRHVCPAPSPESTGADSEPLDDGGVHDGPSPHQQPPRLDVLQDGPEDLPVQPRLAQAAAEPHEGDRVLLVRIALNRTSALEAAEKLAALGVDQVDGLSPGHRSDSVADHHPAETVRQPAADRAP